MAKSKYGIAAHEIGTYKTDCQCKDRYHRRFREGVEHLKSCADANTLYFCGHYQEPRAVAKKEDGRIAYL